jgi:hypothetical protein
MAEVAVESVQGKEPSTGFAPRALLAGIVVAQLAWIFGLLLVIASIAR